MLREAYDTNERIKKMMKFLSLDKNKTKKDYLTDLIENEWKERGLPNSLLK